MSRFKALATRSNAPGKGRFKQYLLDFSPDIRASASIQRRPQNMYGGFVDWSQTAFRVRRRRRFHYSGPRRIGQENGPPWAARVFEKTGRITLRKSERADQNRVKRRLQGQREESQGNGHSESFQICHRIAPLPLWLAANSSRGEHFLMTREVCL